MPLSANIQWLRTQRHMTQAGLAAQTRVHHHHPTPSYISRLEHGLIDPRWSTIKSIARALHVHPWYLAADIADNTLFWDNYLSLSPEAKREIQRLIARKSNKGGTP